MNSDDYGKSFQNGLARLFDYLPQLIGAVSLGLSGLGGRDVAARLLEQAYDAGRANADVAKRDISRAKANTKREASRAADRLS